MHSRMAWQGLTQSINIGFATMDIKIKSKVLLTKHKHGKTKRDLQPNYQPTNEDLSWTNN